MLVELKDCEGLNLFDAICEKAGVGLHSPCGKRGACGGCAVKLLRGRVAEASRVRHPGETVRSCKSIILSGSLAVIVEPRSVEAAASVEKSFEILAPFEALKTRGCSVAVDIGTTTVAASLFSNGDGRVLDSASAVNGQAKFADNVPDRIRLDGKPTNLSMQKEILKTLEELLLPWDGRFSKAVISGNTAMLHFLCGEDASGMGKYPFEPAFLETRDFSSKGLFESLSEFRICTLPSASAFIGADIVAGLMAVGIENAGENCLFVDMGTNGEIVLKKGDSFYSASAAAGPAFEAYGLACGMRASRGAVSSLSIGRGFEVALETIGGAAPAGICGSAYLDFLAEARRGGVLGESGRFAEMCPVKKVDGGRIFNSDENAGYVFGGGYSSDGNDASHGSISNVYGSANVEISGGSVTNVYGGAYVNEAFGYGSASGGVMGGTNISITGGEVANVYGGGLTERVTGTDGLSVSSFVKGGSKIVISGGASVGGDVYGGGNGADSSLEGGTTVVLKDGASVAGTIYGGGANGATVSGERTFVLGSSGGTHAAASPVKVSGFDKIKIFKSEAVLDGIVGTADANMQILRGYAGDSTSNIRLTNADYSGISGTFDVSSPVYGEGKPFATSLINFSDNSTFTVESSSFDGMSLSGAGPSS